jgi:hypothetical protein
MARTITFRFRLLAATLLTIGVAGPVAQPVFSMQRTKEWKTI